MTWIWVVGLLFMGALAAWAAYLWRDAEGRGWAHAWAVGDLKVQLSSERAYCTRKCAELETIKKREAELLPALKWARDLAPRVVNYNGATYLYIANGMVASESFDEILNDIKARYEAHLKRETEKKTAEAVERELDARKRLVPVKRTRKGGTR